MGLHGLQYFHEVDHLGLALLNDGRCRLLRIQLLLEILHGLLRAILFGKADSEIVTMIIIRVIVIASRRNTSDAQCIGLGVEPL